MQERAESGKSRVKTPIKYDRYQEGGVYGEACKEVQSVIRPDLRYPRSIQKFNRERGLHPTQKPVALFEYLIKTYTNEGDLVLDNCAGSGTTGVACKNTNRNFILIEKEQEYIDIINKRLEKILPPQNHGTGNDR